MNLCVHYQFEDQVNKVPRSIAVAIENEYLTYDELNCRANQVARYLRGMGVRRNDLVAICSEFSLELVVALLGVLKAGAAYVPLDPTYPSERIKFIMEQTKSLILLTQAHLNLSNILSQKVLCLDSDWTEIAKHSSANLLRENSVEDLIYCIYTSGSTGSPKGALNLHRGFANLCEWYSSAEACGGFDNRTMVISSIGFDLTQKNIFEPLVSGGLLIFGSRRIGDLGEIEAAVRRYRPTRINCAPSAFEALKSVLFCDSLLMVVLGGESVNARVAEEIVDRGVHLMNSYGPTECSDVAMYYVGFVRGDDFVPLGKPIPNVEIYLVDTDMRLIEGAGVGELCIGGVGVGRGYIAEDDLTEDRFIVNPFGGKPGLLYRTGDLVRRMINGTMWYVRRMDHQVKIRGNRIELGEVESALIGHEAVNCAVVITHENQAGDKRLVAFVVVREGVPGISIESLCEYLSQHLPVFMIPTVWKFPENLPLNASGKIDRLALRQVANNDSFLPLSSVEATTPTEQILVDIWRETLGIRNVGVEDDFFMLGGDSLSAIKMLIAIRERLMCELSLETIYSWRTIRKLAIMLEAYTPRVTMQIGSQPHYAPSIAGSYKFTPSFSQIQDLRKPVNAFSFLKNYSFGFQVNGQLDIELFSRAVVATIKRQEALRTSFAFSANGEVIGRVSADTISDMEVVQLFDLEPDSRVYGCVEMMSIIGRSSFDISVAPLLRCVVGRRSGKDFLCVFNLHHAIADAWSMSVLTRDIGEEYSRLKSGASVNNARILLFSDFALAERKAAAQGTFHAKEQFWREELLDLPKYITIPFASSMRPKMFSYSGDAVRFGFDEEFTRSIRRLCAKRGVTPYMVMLTCLFLMLNNYSGEEDLYIRSPASNRSDKILTDIIGPFGTVIVIRLLVRRGTRGLELLQRVKGSVLKAHKNLGLPPQIFGKCFQGNSGTAFGSKFQVTYNHHNYPPHPTRWEKLRLVKIEEEFCYIKGDMVLHSWFEGERLSCALAFYTEILTKSNAEILAKELKNIVAELVCKGMA